MGFFSELDMEYRQKGYSRPFMTPIYSEYILKQYKKKRKEDKSNEKSSG
jgi:hypothetical protein